MIEKPHYDSLRAWLAHASDDEVVEAIRAAYTDEQIEEIIEELDRLIAAHPEQ